IILLVKRASQRPNLQFERSPYEPSLAAFKADSVCRLDRCGQLIVMCLRNLVRADVREVAGSSHAFLFFLPCSFLTVTDARYITVLCCRIPCPKHGRLRAAAGAPVSRLSVGIPFED